MISGSVTRPRCPREIEALSPALQSRGADFDPAHVAFGSRTEELKVSTTSPLYPEKQTLAHAAGMSH